MMVWPASCLIALVTSSLVSRTATDASTGRSQAKMAARTSVRASAGAAGPTASEMRRRCCCCLVGRIGVVVSIWLPCWAEVGCARARNPPCAASQRDPAKVLVADRSGTCITNLLQVAEQDIVQLTDIRSHNGRPATRRRPSRVWTRGVAAGETEADLTADLVIFVKGAVRACRRRLSRAQIRV